MPSKPLGRLEPVHLRNYWQDESRDFSFWLAKEENLGLLSDTLGMDLETEGVEVSVGPYKADIVAHDISSDVRVVIENQLEKTNHDHLGKILTYASGLDAPVMIWIAKEFSEEHRRALDFVNEHASPNLRCYGLEIQLWKIGDSEPAPQFKIISSPNEYSSEVRTDKSVGELSEVAALYLDFWQGFKEYSSTRNTFLKLRKAQPQHWFTIAVGRSEFHISLTASQQNRRIGCELYLRGVNAKSAFKMLAQKKVEIESQTGALEWMELPQGQDCRIALFKREVDVKDRQNWEGAYAWFKENAEKFYRVFSPIIKSLPIMDSEETVSNGE